jgi:hypothetical protein
LGNNVSLKVPKLSGGLATLVAMRMDEIPRELGCEARAADVIKESGSAG